MRSRAGLLEGLEDRLETLGWNSNPGVAHEDPEWLTRCRVAFGSEHDASLMREADGVAREVDQDLLHENAVALDRDHVVRDVHAQLHRAVAWLSLELSGNLANHLVHGDEAHRDRHASRLDLRDVEDVVHQREQVLTIRGNALKEGELLLRQSAAAVLFHDVREANH